MNVQAIFGLQILLSVLAWGAIASVLSPWLRRLSKRDALLWLTAPHMFRHIGLVFLVPGVVDQPLRSSFALPAAFGDLLTGVLALVAFFALRSRLKLQFQLVWLFTIVGTFDLLNALRNPDVVPMFGAAWYVPTFLVPLLLVTHVMTFSRLLSAEGVVAGSELETRPAAT